MILKPFASIRDFRDLQAFIPNHDRSFFFFSVRRLSACSCHRSRTFHATPRMFGPTVAFSSCLTNRYVLPSLLEGDRIFGRHSRCLW